MLNSMKSRWYELKPAVLALRSNGKSLTFIETHLGIPRSTLSGWCKEIKLTAAQQQTMAQGKLAALLKARIAASERSRAEKQLRLEEARNEAEHTLASVEITPELIELGLAMLYQGGKKYKAGSLKSSDPGMIAFFVAALRVGYGVKPEDLTCELSLQQGQDTIQEARYWSKKIAVPMSSFKKVHIDKRVRVLKENTYHGICLVDCPEIAIQRKLVYLYKSFSEKIINIVGD
jgi:hypothetical protein